MRLTTTSPELSVVKVFWNWLASETSSTELLTPSPDGSVTRMRNSPELLCPNRVEAQNRNRAKRRIVVRRTASNIMTEHRPDVHPFVTSVRAESPISLERLRSDPAVTFCSPQCV